ncbi:MAG: 4-carboxy-4-hydroxy-2-oxoadipate aldolase/oxaloacetate decarboxylase [Thaumarchaeota archaeon]|nr:4-carboxy-4-hydroxy-2-oxoadipate aldolase/oxaloacetate decarboxylase [Nitrososphaerota archaeon]
MAIIVKKINRPDTSLIKEVSGFGVATLHESLGKETNNLMDWQIKPIGRGMKVTGPAVTVDCFPADNITVHRAMTLCSPGDVLVVNGRSSSSAMFGSQMAHQSVHTGIAGIVVDGAVRDSEELRKMGFACFARFVSGMGAAKNTPGSINVPIQCGGVLVNPGDVIVGDDDGVVVVPSRKLQGVIELAKKRENKEAEARELYAMGSTSMELNRFQEIFDALKVKEQDTLDDLME